VKPERAHIQLRRRAACLTTASTAVYVEHPCFQRCFGCLKLAGSGFRFLETGKGVTCSCGLRLWQPQQSDMGKVLVSSRSKVFPFVTWCLFWKPGEGSHTAAGKGCFNSIGIPGKCLPNVSTFDFVVVSRSSLKRTVGESSGGTFGHGKHCVLKDVQSVWRAD
jgi:hypothetical protein